MKRLLIFVAVNEEFKILKRLLTNSKGSKRDRKAEFPSLVGKIKGFDVDLVMTSMGMEKSLKCAQNFVDPQIHGGVIILGYCGGLSLTLKNSDFVIPTRVISSRDQKVFQMDEELVGILGKIIISEGYKYRAVPLITQPLVVETSVDKHLLFRKSLAEAVDMETSEIVRIAIEKNVKVMALRIVIDDVETELPRFNDLFRRKGKMDHLNVASVLAAQPGLSLGLSNNMRQADHVLHKILPQIIEKIGQRWNISGASASASASAGT